MKHIRSRSHLRLVDTTPYEDLESSIKPYIDLEDRVWNMLGNGFQDEEVIDHLKEGKVPLAEETVQEINSVFKNR